MASTLDRLGPDDLAAMVDFRWRVASGSDEQELVREGWDRHGARSRLDRRRTIKEAIIDLIEQENRARQLTVLIVSHEMAIVRRLCHRVTVMIEGRIGAEGTLDEVAARADVLSAYLGKGWT